MSINSFPIPTVSLASSPTATPDAGSTVLGYLNGESSVKKFPYPISTSSSSITAVKCFSRERFELPVGTTTEIFNVSGAGSITKLWFAFESLSSGVNVRNITWKMTFNDAATPQVNGVRTQDLVGLGIDAPGIFHSGRLAVTRNDTSHYGGFLKIPMPYKTSARIEVTVPAGSGFLWCWLMVQYADNPPPVGQLNLTTDHVLHIDNTVFTVAATAEQTLLETVIPTYLLGFFQRFTPGSGGQDLKYQEGDYRIYFDGSLTADFQSSGTEDLFDSSWYFNEGPFIKDEEALLGLNDFTGEMAAYKFWFTEPMPRGSTGLKLTWQNGDPIYLTPAYSTVCNNTLFYYE